MADAEATDVDLLNQLIHINRDAEAGFRAAAENIKNSELETLFNNYAAQHAKFTADLEDEIVRLRGTISDSGTFGGNLHRGWMDLMSTLSGNSASVMLKSCEDGEQSAESAYLDAADTYDGANEQADRKTLAADQRLPDAAGATDWRDRPGRGVSEERIVLTIETVAVQIRSDSPANSTKCGRRRSREKPA